jgi:predicted dehydrogenase
MSDPRLVVVGLHFGMTHAKNILSSKVDGKLVAVCDVNPAFKDFAARSDIRYYQDYSRLLEKEEIDGVIIAVPPHLHLQIGAAFAQRGVHLLVEKPITPTIEQADELIGEAERNRVQLLVGHMQRFDPNVVHAKKMIHTGELGEITGFQLTSAMVKSPSYFREDWRHKRATAGGPLMSNGIHDVDRLRYLCGEVTRVTGVMSNSHRGYEVENSSAVSFEMQNGTVGTYFLTDCGQTFSEHTDVYYGSRASIAFNCSSMASTKHRHLIEKVSWEPIEQGHYERKKNAEILSAPFHDCHLEEMRHFCRVITQREEPRTSGMDAKKSLMLLLAVIEAVDENRTVTLQ